jgi:hypothetical protein
LATVGSDKTSSGDCKERRKALENGSRKDYFWFHYGHDQKQSRIDGSRNTSSLLLYCRSQFSKAIQERLGVLVANVTLRMYLDLRHEYCAMKNKNPPCP